MFPLGWVNQLLGLAMNGIDWCMYHLLGVHYVGWCIVIFSLFVYILMYPLNAKQQKSSRLMNKINPEIKAIQKKYKNKKDQASQMKMNQETQDIYAKYGISPFGGCLPLLITMPILFALYNVIRNIPYYVNGIGSMKENPEAYKFLGLLVNESPMSLFKDRANYPYAGILVFLIPILAMVLQFINTNVIQSGTDNNQDDNPMGQSMKMMNNFMPIMSAFIAFSVPAGLGLYWIATAVIQTIIQICINRYYDKLGVDEIVRRNVEQRNKKRAKKGLPPEKIAKNATTSTKKIDSETKSQERIDKLQQKKEQNDKKVKEILEATNYYKSAKPGSLAEKAGMVAKYIEKNSKKN